MLDNSQGYEFKVIIDDLRDKAKDQLRDCRNNKYSLYDYIKKFDEVNIVRNIYNDPLKKDYSRLAQLAEYDIEDEKDFLFELWKRYFEVLFKRMRQQRQQILQKEGCSNE